MREAASVKCYSPFPRLCKKASVQIRHHLTEEARCLGGRILYWPPHVVMIPPLILPRDLWPVALVNRHWQGRRRKIPKYLRSVGNASMEIICLSRGHAPFPGQPTCHDLSREKYKSPNSGHPKRASQLQRPHGVGLELHHGCISLFSLQLFSSSFPRVHCGNFISFVESVCQWAQPKITAKHSALINFIFQLLHCFMLFS